MDIKVPQVRGDDLGPAVVEQLPESAAYLLSFVVTVPTGSAITACSGCCPALPWASSG
ncbi:hypothetical protein QNO00_15080 [Arthrobacter sp. zg-Y1219]|uniref:hypothetical protein n=1 Tax=Arthrobacter sp. zg-Y1219 TaxID=3049067 RepID=UPI0024C31432|nr:hypothetical protein [Arthrobacter sp. zg-Y1219]MDK1361578.1 hypothetical protein [Arthrobacter sp. zg-Y1219]